MAGRVDLSAPRLNHLADPWLEERSRAGLNTLVRVIDVDAGTQEFRILNPLDRNDLSDLEFNGRTVILPAEEHRTPAQLAEIVHRFDELYRQDPAAARENQTRQSVRPSDRGYRL